MSYLRTWMLPLLICLVTTAAHGQDNDEKSTPAEKAVNKLRQPGESVVETIDPVKTPTDAEKAKADALTWFMTGRLRQRAAESRELTPAKIRKLRLEAYQAYEKSIELNPDALQPYQEIIPLAFQMNRTKQATEFAQKAVKLDPTDYRLLRLLGDINFRAQRLAETLKYYQQAAESDKLDRLSPDHVLLRRDLAVLFGLAQDLEKSADSYEIVFDARRNPAKYNLDPRITRALDQDPQTSYMKMGQIFLASNRAKKAVESLELALKGKDPGKTNFLLAKAYLEAKEYDKAEETWQAYFDAGLKSKDVPAYTLLADILKESQREDELIPRLEFLSKDDDKNSVLLFFLANAYTDAEQLDKAETLYLKTMEGPGAGQPAGFIGLARVYRLKNEAELVMTTLADGLSEGTPVDLLTPEMDELRKNEELLKSALDMGKQRLADGEIDAVNGFLYGRLAADAKKNDDATKFFKIALDEKPKGDLALALFTDYGGLMLETDQYEEAAEIYDAAASHPDLKPNRPIMFYRLSFAHELNGNTDKALVAITNARRALPSAPLLHYQEGWIYQHAKQYDRAVEVYERVMKQFATDTETLRKCQLSLSTVYVAQGDTEKGEKILEDVLQEDPDDITVNNDLGYLYADQGKNLERAEGMIRKALEAEPENAAYLDSMGWVLYRLERHDEAATYLEKAIAQPSGPDATIYEHLGDVYKKLNRSDDAMKAWKNALKELAKESNPDPKVKDRLEEKTNE